MPPTRSKTASKRSNSIDSKPVKRQRKDVSMQAARRGPLAAKKIKELANWLETPYPGHVAPTHAQAQTVHDALMKVHPNIPKFQGMVDYDMKPVPPGKMPNLLNNVIRTVLSQNTNTANEMRASSSLFERFGDQNYLAVHRASEEDVIDALRCGGLANVKGKAIKDILKTVAETQMMRQGLKSEEELETLDLDYLADLTEIAALEELVSFKRVGPKTANGIMMFGLGRDRMAVDTHIHRISQSLGWIPKSADAEAATRHLNVRLPAHLKKPLHVLFIWHGQSCRRCSAGGKLVTTRFAGNLDIPVEDCPIKRYLQ